jgi:hypothetical protein
VAKPIKFFGNKGLVRFNAVCMATTPPTKNEINDTIPTDRMIKESTSLMMRSFITLHREKRVNTLESIKK